MVNRARRAAPPRSAADVVRNRYGATVSRVVAEPLLKAWSGADAGDLAPSAVTTLPTSLPVTAALHCLREITGAPIALGYCRERPIHPFVLHVYPAHGGIGA